MKLLLAFSFLIMSLFGTNVDVLNTENCIEDTANMECEVLNNCCGYVTISEAFCNGLPQPYYKIIFRRADKNIGKELSPGSNYVQVRSGKRYIIEFQVGNGTACLPINASWNICGTSGSSTIQPGETASLTAGYTPTTPCFGF